MNCVTLYRLGSKLLKLIKESGYQKFPPRLLEQPIFYPVLNEYAIKIARDWKVSASGSGFVTNAVDEELKEFNNNIVDRIKVIAEFYSTDD